MKLRLHRVAAVAAAGLLVAACAALPPAEIATRDPLRARVGAILERRALGPDALSVIDNLVRHDAGEPLPYAPPVVRELLADPLASADAQTLFYRVVPGALRRFVDELSAPPARGPWDGTPPSLRVLLDAYLAELAEAQLVLRSAPRGGAIDGDALILQMRENLPSADRLGAIGAGVDQEALDRATSRFLGATARFVRRLRAAGDRLHFPRETRRFESAVGVVVIGTPGDDAHGADAAVIIDPGGDDTYTRTPVTGGAISVIVDLGGRDRYRGSDLVVHGLSAIVDFSGDDDYAATGPGLGAAIAGAAIVVDLAGDDRYAAGLFGEGAAAFGLGALVDLSGNDDYRLGAGGQGLGLAGGIGLLWDRAGNDGYVASGLKDVYGRGGGLSWAQGAAFGFRTSLGGGIGILRDDGGDDRYEAELYAQGAGYYHGLGLLWEGAGDDRYRAARYAQGGGVHEAVGVLRDESGNDRYELSVGVGQGMGLDLAVGLLLDGGGDDRYRAPLLAQGAATSNGLGVLSDGGGADLWHVDDPRQGWGRAEWSRGLPTLGVMVYDPTRAAFSRKDGNVAPSPAGAGLGGPLGSAAVTHEPRGEPRCPAAAPATAAGELPLLQALRRLAPAFAGHPFDLAAYSSARQRLAAGLEASLAELPPDDFDVVWSLGAALRCVLSGATADEAAALWNAMERVLAGDPKTPYAGAIMSALGGRPAPAPQMARILTALDTHPACGMRAAALRLRRDAAPATAEAAAQGALRSPCWRLQAAALDVLRQLGAAPDPGAALPSFLRRHQQAAAPEG